MVANGSVGVAFAMVVGGGLATCIGACIVFCIKLATPKLLASSLGFAAGVMLYVCFAEIFLRKSVFAFQDENYSADQSYMYATLCFFGGMAFIWALDQLVHLLVHHSERITAAFSSFFLSPVRGMMRTLSRRHLPGAGGGGDGSGRGGKGSAAGDWGAQGPSWDQPEQQEKESKIQQPQQQQRQQRQQQHVSFAVDQQEQQQQAEKEGEGSTGSAAADLESGCCAESSCCDCPLQEGQQETAVGVPEGAADVLEVLQKDPHAFELQKMGVLVALAMGIHNFPEGLATFVGALSDTKVGAAVATAIAIHNIPEGICVAMPIYYATGSRWKAFLWAAIPGLFEPLGGLLGYVALHDNNNLAFAIVFGLVSGMMVFISIRELLPAAYKYDPDDKVTSTAVVVGMAVMAASLLLFLI